MVMAQFVVTVQMLGSNVMVQFVVQLMANNAVV